MAFKVIVFGACMVRRNGRHHDQGMGSKNRSAYGRRHMYRSGCAREGNWFARCSGRISLTMPDRPTQRCNLVKAIVRPRLRIVTGWKTMVSCEQLLQQGSVRGDIGTTGRLLWVDLSRSRHATCAPAVTVSRTRRR